MKTWNGYQKGINLGGWLSQCNYEKNHLDTFITKDDIKKIKSWGLDHVRLPFDFNIIQDKNGSMISDGFKYLDNAVEWCKEEGLNIILDLHKASGFSFDKGENESGLFGNEEQEKRFIDLWIFMAERYGKIGDNVSFELLNEVTLPSFNDAWMNLAKTTIEKIRQIAPDVQILIGGYWNNSPDAVKDIIPPPDDKVYYTFHCYTPLCFTHQGAEWVDEMPADFRLKYPFDYDSPECDGAKPAFEKMKIQWPTGKTTPEKFEENFSSALKTAQERNVILYCGEYGVIDLADAESTLNWFTDINLVLTKYNIGRAVWNYKEKNFGISGEHYDSIRPRLLKVL